MSQKNSLLKEAATDFPFSTRIRLCAHDKGRDGYRVRLADAVVQITLSA